MILEVKSTSTDFNIQFPIQGDKFPPIYDVLHKSYVSAKPPSIIKKTAQPSLRSDTEKKRKEGEILDLKPGQTLCWSRRGVTATHLYKISFHGDVYASSTARVCSNFCLQRSRVMVCI